MDCPELRTQLPRYLDEETGLDERWKIERHLAGCVACREELASLRRIGSLLRAGDAGGAPVGDSFRTATLEAARTLVQRRAPATRRLHPLAWILPLAAGIAVVLGWSVLRTPAAPPISATTMVKKTEPAAEPMTPLAQYEHDLAALADADVLGHYKLGEWATARGLSEQAAERFRHVVALDPEHAPSRGRLDFIHYQGRWIARADALAQGLSQRHGEWLSAEERERIDKGLRYYEGRWRSPEEILTAKGYTFHNGTWLTQAEIDAGEAKTNQASDEVTVRGITASAAPDAMQILEGVVVGEPYTYAHLSLYPLLATEEHRAGVLTLGEASRAGTVQVVDENSVALWNRGEEPVYVASGQIFIGGHQDRMNLRSVVVAPHDHINVDVRCCEHNRSSGKPAFDRLQAWAPLSIRRLAVEGDQNRIWDQIAGFLSRSQAVTGTLALSAVYDNPAFLQRFQGYQEALAPLPTNAGTKCLGVVAVIGDRVAGIDLFGGGNLFQSSYPQILTSLTADALLEENAAAPVAPSRKYVRSFVERLAFARYRPIPIDERSNRMNVPQELQQFDADFGAQERLEGQALVYKGKAVHVAVYAQEKN